MQHNITIYADTDITCLIESYLREFKTNFAINYKADSYMDCLNSSITNKTDIFIIQAKPPIAYVDDLLIALQRAGVAPMYILFQVINPGMIRFAATTNTNPLAEMVKTLFQEALKGAYGCEHISYTTTLLNDNNGLSADVIRRHEALLEILRGCSEQEFLFYRDNFGLNIKDEGYYLFFWELMGVEFADHESNKFIYNFSGEMLQRECYEIINEYNGGEVFYSTPNLLCIIINDLSVKSEAGKRAKIEEMIQKLAYCTGNKVACRYLSDRIDTFKRLHYACEKYHTEKSISFFLRDMSIMRPSLIEAQKHYTDVKTINALVNEITDFLRYDIFNPALETDLSKLYFSILKPAMSFTLYYSNIAIIYNALAEVQYPFDELVPLVNNSPNLLQFSSIEEQYNILLDRIRAIRSQNTKKKGINSDIVRKAVNYIAQNYQQDISITDISSALFISSVHLSQIFKRETNMGVIKYLINYRIEQAEKLLKETDDFIYAISENVGFNEFRHFSRTFKELTGFSPTEYRKKYRSKQN